MADSFFGFDTTLPRDDDFGGRDPEEKEYDALNDETFNQAVSDDWEDGHETLVRYENKSISIDKLDESDYDSDLDINFIPKLEDFDITNDDNDARNNFQLDPSVWATPVKPITPTKVPHMFQNQHHHNNSSSSDMARKFQLIQPPPGLSSLSQQTNALQQLIGAVPPTSNAAPKILSLEEIERNMINQQHQKIMQEKLAAIQSKVQGVVQQPPPQPVAAASPQQQQQQRKPAQQQPQQPGMIFPPNAGPPHLMNGPPPPFAPVPPHLQGPNLSKFNPLMNITNHPMMNNPNFHHPNFPSGPMRPPLQPIPNQMNRMPPHLMGAPLMYQQQQQQQQQNSAQFNQRLVQEIQQNHPMLNPMFQQQQQQQQHRQQFGHYGNQHGMGHHHSGQHHHNNHQQQRFNNGKMEEFDEYANLMSNRDKQFLITIQLMQLNTETPYFDDYYYTMYKERQRLRGINNESQAFRDNQMNHPFTQPRGHAQMLLRQFNNISKNGMQNGRERRTSESSTKNEKENPTPRTYTPLQFENSLGKLQCGSVTAPRKIIDMEIINAENGTQNASEKKSRQILMHIEMLYKIVLKLEDMQHPMAIAATIILKEKREKQRLQLEQEARDRQDSEDTSTAGSTKSSISLNEPETLSELQSKLLTVLNIEKIPGMMAVRKGRALLKRIFPHIKDQAIRWDFWSAVFLSISIFKRDKIEEFEDSLMLLYYEFAVHLQDASFAEMLKITNALMTSEKLMGLVNGCKFIVSSIIAMIIKCELIYQKSGDSINHAEEEQWIQFLNKLFEIVNNDRTVDAQILSSANNIHRDKNDHERIIRTVVAHFHRFQPRFTSDNEKIVKLLGIQYDVK